MASWGLVTLALAYTQNAAMFYILRFLLGACEAGFFPGVLFVLTIWFPYEYRARMVGWFMIFSAIANAIGAPIGGMLLDLDGALGLRGWQWVFLATGVPAVIMAVVTLIYLDDRPESAHFLNQAEKDWLHGTLAEEDRSMAKTKHANPFAALLDSRVLLMSLFCVAFPLGAYGLSYWLPTIVKSFGVSNTVNGFINIIPWLFVAVALWLAPTLANRTGRTTPYIVGPALFGALCLVLSVYVPGDTAKFIFLCGARLHQLGRQSRRLHRPERRPLDPRRHRQHHCADAVPCGLHGLRRPDDLRGPGGDPPAAQPLGRRVGIGRGVTA